MLQTYKSKYNEGVRGQDVPQLKLFYLLSPKRKDNMWKQKKHSWHSEKVLTLKSALGPHIAPFRKYPCYLERCHEMKKISTYEEDINLCYKF